jgi:hypothetical protein
VRCLQTRATAFARDEHYAYSFEAGIRSFSGRASQDAATVRLTGLFPALTQQLLPRVRCFDPPFLGDRELWTSSRPDSTTGPFPKPVS